MSDLTDDPKPGSARPQRQPSLDATPTVYSSLDAPPPPFQLKQPSAARRDAPARSSSSKVDWRPRPRTRNERSRVKPAAVRMRRDEAAPPSPTEEARAPRVERLPDDATNPGAVLAVVVSLVVSAVVFVLAGPY